MEQMPEQAESNEEQAAHTSPPPVPAAKQAAASEAASPKSPKRAPVLPSLMGLPVGRADTGIIVLLAAAADLCLYARPGGTGASCLLLAALAGLVMAQRGRTTRANCLLAVVVMLAAVLMAWRHWWLLYVVGWSSLLVFAAKRQRPDWPLLEALWGALQTIVQAPVRLAGHFQRRGQETPASADGDGGPAPRKGAGVRVVAIPVAVCALFLLIFAAANPVVTRVFETIGAHVSDFFCHIGEYVTIGRVMLWLLWLMLFAALIRPAVKSRLARWLETYGEELKQDRSAALAHDTFASAFWTLVSVNVLFLAYNAMDSVYLYLKATLPAGITWTDYTHRGCGWLTLGLLVSSVVIGSIFRGGLNFHPRARGLKKLSYVWAAQNGLLAIGSMRRLQMYIDFSGLTHLRITGIYGSLLVAAGLAIMVYKVRTNRGFIWLVRRYVLAFCMALTILALTPNEWVCASYNVKKIMEHKPRALRPVFLKRLSPEALPPLVALLDYERDDGDAVRQRMVREGVAALLGRHLKELDARDSVCWAKQQGSARWALKHLRAAGDRIHTVVSEDRWNSARGRILEDYDLSSPKAVAW